MSHLSEVLDELNYPIARDTAASSLAGTHVLFADGEANLGELLEEVPQAQYQRRVDLEADLHTVLPRRAVGEPFQSEGDA